MLSSHSEGAVKIYRHRGQREGCNAFENSLISTLRGPVLFEAIFNSNINLTAEEWNDLVGFGNNKPNDTIEYIMRALRLMREGGFVMDCKAVNHVLSPSIEFEAQMLRRRYLPILAGLQDSFYASETPTQGQKPDVDAIVELKRCHRLRMYGLGLFVAILLNYIISTTGVPQAEILDESERHAEEVVFLARVATRYRPLGAGIFAICLPTAWIISRNVKTKIAAEELRLEYEKDFRDTSFTYS